MEEDPLTAAQGSLVAEAFELGHVAAIKHAADGMTARIWQLDTSLGRFAVKAFFSVPDLDALVSRLQVAADLSDRASRAGVVTSQAVRTSTGDLVLPLTHEVDAAPTYVAVSSWTDGRPFDLGRDVSAVGPWLGATVATIELLPDPPNAPSLDPWLAGWLTTVPSEEQWDAAVDDGLRTRRPWTDLLTTRLPDLLELGSTVVPPGSDRLTLLHTDLQPKNVLVTPDGYALMDWDDAALCSRDHILGRALVEWFVHGGVHAHAVSGFMARYRSRGGQGIIGSLSDFSYATASSLNWLHEMVTTDVAHHGSTGGSGMGVVAALTEPLNVSSLEEMLDRVGPKSRRRPSS